MSDALLLGILGIITSVLTVTVPIWRAKMDNAQRNLERKEDRDRQDLIAANLAAKVKATATDATTVRNAISDKLDVVQTLVNGNVTDLMRRELDGLRREINLLEENRELKATLQQEPNPMEAARLDFSRAQLKDLSIKLAAKMKADETAAELKTRND